MVLLPRITWCKFGVNQVILVQFIEDIEPIELLLKCHNYLEIREKARKHCENSILLHRTHNPKVGGSNPSPATKVFEGVSQFLANSFFRSCYPDAGWHNFFFDKSDLNIYRTPGNCSSSNSSFSNLLSMNLASIRSEINWYFRVGF